MGSQFMKTELRVYVPLDDYRLALLLEASAATGQAVGAFLEAQRSN
jgi:hypothetical protein